MSNSKIKLVVVNENTLAYQYPGKENEINVLSAFKTKGSRFANYNNMNNFLLSKSDSVRLASGKDFDGYRVSFEGFNNPNEYDFKN